MNKKIKLIKLELVMFEGSHKGSITFFDADTNRIRKCYLNKQGIISWRGWLYAYANHITNDYNIITDTLVMQFYPRTTAHRPLR